MALKVAVLLKTIVPLVPSSINLQKFSSGGRSQMCSNFETGE